MGEKKGNEILERGSGSRREKKFLKGTSGFDYEGAVWTSLALLLVLTGLFRGS